MQNTRELGGKKLQSLAITIKKMNEIRVSYYQYILCLLLFFVIIAIFFLKCATKSIASKMRKFECLFLCFFSFSFDFGLMNENEEKEPSPLNSKRKKKQIQTKPITFFSLLKKPKSIQYLSFNHKNVFASFRVFFIFFFFKFMSSESILYLLEFKFLCITGKINHLFQN